MRVRMVNSWLQRKTVLVLCFLLSLQPVFAQQAPPPAEPAGEVNAVLTNATRNAAPVKLTETVTWNDLLKTDTTGRMRVGLRDGSSLSLGSDSQITVLKHDPTAQQTSLEILYGRLRSRVIKLLKPGAKFEVNTPQATAGVIGTDFILLVDAVKTTIIVISGVVLVTPHALGAGITPTQADQARSVHVNSGHTLEVGPSGVGVAVVTSKALLQENLLQTSIPTQIVQKGALVSHGSHLVRNVLIGLAAAGAVAGGVVAGTQGGGKNPRIPPR